jgi:penicillin-binding protein 2
MGLAALETKKRTPEFAIADPGFYSLPNIPHRYRDHKKDGHGSVNLHKAIVVSCDTYFYQLAVDMQIDKIHEYLDLYGFGQPTGVDIEGELSGLNPSQGWKERRFKQRWYAGDTVSIGIGQGYMLTTPLQLAVATATLANNGVPVHPRLLKALQDSKTQQMREIPSKNGDVSTVKAENLAIIRAAMIDVTRPGGTAVRAAQGASYTIAAKTGTAQVIGMKQGESYNEKRIKEEHRDHALFIAFAPADDPKLALAILVENGGHGGSTAAPIAREVFDYHILGKKPAVRVPLGGDEETSD